MKIISNHPFSKLLALLLSLLMIVSVLAACQNKPKPDVTTGPEGQTAGETESNELIAKTPKQDFKGRDFTFLTVGTSERYCKEIFVEIEKFVSNNAQQSAEQMIIAGDTSCDVYDLYKHGCITLVSSGYTRDWTVIPHLDFESPWWNASAFENLTVNGKLLLMSGSILITEIDDTIAMVYNKNINSEFQEQIGFDIMDEVLNGGWTLDQFIKAVTSISEDLNHDGTIEIGEDLIGYVADPNSMAMNWPFACGFVKEGTITNGEYSANVTSAMTGRVTTMLEKLVGMFATDSADQSKQLDDDEEYFREDKALICAIILRSLESMRNMESDYGVIPYPKYNENQKDYITHVGGASPIMIIPMQNDADDDRLGNILEAMCEASYRITRPAYYEIALKEKMLRDENSKKALDIILESRTYDLAYISASGLAWLVGGMVAANNSSFSRMWQRQGSRIEKTVQSMIDSIIENNS